LSASSRPSVRLSAWSASGFAPRRNRGVPRGASRPLLRRLRGARPRHPGPSSQHGETSPDCHWGVEVRARALFWMQQGPARRRGGGHTGRNISEPGRRRQRRATARPSPFRVADLQRDPPAPPGDALHRPNVADRRRRRLHDEPSAGVSRARVVTFSPCDCVSAGAKLAAAGSRLSAGASNSRA